MSERSERTEAEAADVLGEIEDAIKAGRSMGQGAWAILNRVRRLTRPTSMVELQREMANPTPAEMERLATAVLGPTNMLPIPDKAHEYVALATAARIVVGAWDGAVSYRSLDDAIAGLRAALSSSPPSSPEPPNE